MYKCKTKGTWSPFYIMEDFNLCYDRQSTHLESQLYILEINIEDIIVSKGGKARGATRYLIQFKCKLDVLTVQTIEL